MTYFPDRAPCTYFGRETSARLVAVGWLDGEHPFARGAASAPFLDTLFGLLERPWAPSYLLGYEDCPWCEYNYDSTYKGRGYALGATNLFIPGEGFLYVMPSLAAHYIVAHGYAPPPEFVAAVLRCPPMGSPAYFQAIAENAPERYAAFARKHLAG